MTANEKAEHAVKELPMHALKRGNMRNMKSNRRKEMPFTGSGHTPDPADEVS